jgi:hypothetical protein
MLRPYLADLIVALHVAYVSFIIGGETLILLGAVRRWQWVRNFWFRIVHLAAIVFVAIEATMGMACPLTVWEDLLRRQAGQDVADGSFIGRCLDRMIFLDLPPWVFNVMHIGFAVLVIATLIVIPPGWPSTKTRES